MRVQISRVELGGKITYQEGAGIAIVTIHRPRIKNAMTVKMWKELGEVINRIPNNPKIRVVIIRGTKDSFTAGSDIKEFSSMSVAEADESFRVMEETISSLEKIPLPTIGLITGPSLGAGLELALACDIRVGTQSAQMGIPIGRLGITLSKEFVKRIVDIVGPTKMKDLVYTGRILDAKESYNWGLLNYLIEKEDPKYYAINLADRIKKQSSASIRAVKERVALYNPLFDFPLSSSFENSVDPEDFTEGTRAFVEKRSPKF